MKKQNPDLILILITLCWGSSFIVTKNVLHTVTPLAFVLLRFGLASLFLLAVFYKKLPKIRKKEWRYGAVLGFMVSLSMMLQSAGLQYTSASNSAFICSLSVILVPLFSAILLRRKIGGNILISIALALTGLFFITGGTKLSVNIGDGLCFLSALFVTTQILLIDKFTTNLNGLAIGMVQIFSVAFFTLLYWLLFDRTPIRVTPEVAFSVSWTAFFCTAFAYTAQVVIQKRTTPTHAALIFTLEPVFALMFALIFPNLHGDREALTLGKAAGCLLIVSGTLLSELDFFRLGRKGKNKKAAS